LEHPTIFLWPKLDADVYVPALLQGGFGSRRMASQLGAARGRVRSQAKAASSRANGRKGGRPRKKTAASRNPAEADRTRSRFRELRAIR